MTAATGLATEQLADAIEGARIALDLLSAGAEIVVENIAQTDHKGLAVQSAIDAMKVLWPNAWPEECGQAGWWTSPLGRLCAGPLAGVTDGVVTHATAAAMLGVARGTVAVMSHRGTLERHPDGGVLRSSVLERLGRQA